MYYFSNPEKIETVICYYFGRLIFILLYFLWGCFTQICTSYPYVFPITSEEDDDGDGGDDPQYHTYYHYHYHTLSLFSALLALPYE